METAQSQRTAVLEAIGIELALPPNITYRDGGFVESIKEGVRIFLCLRGYPFDSEYIDHLLKVGVLNPVWKDETKYGGICFVDNRRPPDIWIGIASVTSGNPDLDLAIKAHEEGHFIGRIGRTDALEDSVRKTGGKRVSLVGVPSETIGVVSSFLALEKKGVPQRESLDLILRKIAPEYEPHIRGAYNLLYES